MTTSQDIADVITRMASEDKAIRTLINGNAADLSALTTGDKTTLVAALNWLKSEVDNAAATGGAAINDASTSTGSVWSSQKTSDEIALAITALVDGAPTALDTLNELAAALNDQGDFAASVTTALDSRLRFDAAQALSAAQKIQGNANLGSVSVADFGSTNTDYVALYEAALL